MNRCVCIHGHFYQPPRENPWLEEIEQQDPAYPYHDWNEKITEDCYAPNAASRILDPERRIIDVVDNYTRISFDFGPTLLSWMEKHAPEVYQAIVGADRKGQKKFSGHGPAIAQAYNHIIMPLANSKDKRTQIIWGIRDFEYHFGREPEGMWLPETAVDIETLEIMAEHGIKFTILAPHQAKQVKEIGDGGWNDARNGKIDPKMPYLCRLPSGRAINIFFYDGQISKEAGFGDLLKNGENFAKRLIEAFSKDDKPQVVHIATDGETYGHHHRFGDMALAYCLHHIESNNLAKITVYGEYLEKYPPTHEIEIVENSSWSCIHGVERWKSDCGCNTGARPGWNQAWRAPLREAMDKLRDALIPIYEKEMASYVRDPWRARDDYIEIILDRSVQNVEAFLSRHAIRELSKDEKVRVLKLLEMQRHAMLMYTSCGWFFDEISSTEPVQVMRYAARAMQLAKEVSGVDLELDFIKILEQAPSNISDYKNGRQVFEMLVKPSVVDLLRLGAHYAISSLFEKYLKTAKIYCFTVNSEMYDLARMGDQKLAVGKARIRSDVTWEEGIIGFVVLHIGGHNLFGGVLDLENDLSSSLFSRMHQEIKKAFLKSKISEAIHLLEEYFSTRCSLWHLFRDEQRKILSQIIEPKLKEIETLLGHTYKDIYPISRAMNEIQVPPPKIFTAVGEFVLSRNFHELLTKEEPDLNRLRRLVEEAKIGSFELDKVMLGFDASRKINTLMEKFSRTSRDTPTLETILTMLRILGDLDLELNLWKSQNIYFSIGKQLYSEMREKADKGDKNAKRWIGHFNELGNYLNVKIT